MRRKLSAASACFFVASFLWLLGLAAPALGAMGRDDFFALVESGDIAEIEVAIRNGQDIEQENSYGETPLCLAVKRGDPEIVRLLLDASANPGHRAGDMTALHYAMIGPAKGRPLGKMVEIVNLLLLNDMSLVNARNRDGTTPLHIAGLLYSDREIRRKIQGDLKDMSRLFGALIHAGADLNTRDKNKEGNTALHEATLGEDEEVALLLIQSGADVNVANNEGATPLCFASLMGLPRVVTALLERGANPNVRMEGVTPLHVATGITFMNRKPSGEWESFGEMLTRTGRDGNDFLKVTKALVEAGAEVNALSSKGEKSTPLDMAEAIGNRAVSEYLKGVGGKNKKPWYWPF